MHPPPAAPPPPARPCGRSGLQLSPLCLALGPQLERGEPPLLYRALDLGVTHFDITPLASHPSAPEPCPTPYWRSLHTQHDELVVTARAGLGTHPGPLTGFGSRKRILSSLDGLLRRTGLDYVDVLYSHRFDSATPLEETMGALATAVQQGKVLYAGLSAYAPALLRRCHGLLAELGTPLVAYQASYSLMNRWIEDGLFDVLTQHGIGCVAAGPTAHGLLTSTLAGHESPDAAYRAFVRPALIHLAATRSQSLEQLSISWILRDHRIASVLTSTTNPQHLLANQQATRQTDFSAAELAALDLCCPSPAAQPPPTPQATA